MQDRKTMNISRALLVVATLLIITSCGPQKSRNLPTPPATTVLISLDGFRYDYIEKHGAENLKKFAESGVRAKKTFSSRNEFL